MPTAVLTVHPAAAAAQRLYLASGWEVVTRELRLAGGAVAWLMGRDRAT